MRRLALQSLVGLFALGLTGCFWPAAGAGPDRAAHNPFENQISPATVSDLEELWATGSLGGSVRAPVVSGPAVHATTFGAVHGIDKATGAELWVKEIPADYPPEVSIMGNSVVEGSNRLIVGYGYGNLGGNWGGELVDAARGDSLGTAPASGFVDGVRGNTVLSRTWGFGSNTPIVTSMRVGYLDDPDAGWSRFISFQQSVAPPMSLGTTRAYQAGRGIMLPLDEGNGLRSYPLEAPLLCEPPATETFACPEWSTALDGTTAVSPVLADGGTSVFTATNVGTVYAVDGVTGAVLWSVPMGAGVNASPALANGVLYVPVADGRLVALDAATGATLWTGSTGSAIGVQPAVAGGVVFTGSGDGSLHAYGAAGCGAATCEPLWTASTGTSAITGAPAVSNGQLYVGTGDGRLVAYGLPD